MSFDAQSINEAPLNKDLHELNELHQSDEDSLNERASQTINLNEMTESDILNSLLQEDEANDI